MVAVTDKYNGRSAIKLQHEKLTEQRMEEQEHRQATEDMRNLVKRHADTSQRNNELLLSIMQTLGQNNESQTIMFKVLDTNLKIYQMVVKMQMLSKDLPPQIERQQPINFEDAHGRIAPSHV